MRNVLPNGVGLLILGTSNTTWANVKLPLRLDGYGLPGCSLLVRPTEILAVPTGASSTLIWAAPVPAALSLEGGTMYFQYTFLDPAANRLGLAWTNGAWNRFRW